MTLQYDPLMSAPKPPEVVQWMRRSVDLGKASRSESDQPKPNVGVVVVREGLVLGESFRGESGPGRHAEFGLLDRLGKDGLSGATVYTTLEPCSRRNPPKIACATHLIEAAVESVYIGMFDPNPAIYREGWRMMRDAGIRLYDYLPELRDEILNDNVDFIAHYHHARGPRGTVSFDPQQNGGRFTLGDGAATIETRWTPRSSNSVYAINTGRHAALARYARLFEEIDDPGALDWANYTVPVELEEIVAFRSESSYALVRLLDVSTGDDPTKSHSEITLEYELRLSGSSSVELD